MTKIIESKVNADLVDYWLNQVITQYREEYKEGQPELLWHRLNCHGT